MHMSIIRPQILAISGTLHDGTNMRRMTLFIPIFRQTHFSEL